MKKYACLAFSMICAAVLFGFTSGKAQTNVSASPTYKNVLPTMSFSLGFNVASASDLHASHVILSFDTTVVKYTSTANGGFLSGSILFANVRHSAFSSFDTLIVDIAILGPGGANGSGTLFSVTFQSKVSGGTPVKIEALDLRNTTNLNIPASGTSGYVSVNTMPVQTFVNPAYSFGNAGGHDYGFDAFNTVQQGVTAVAAGGMVNIASATYNETVSNSKVITITGTTAPTIQNLALTGGTLTLAVNLNISGTLSLSNSQVVTGNSKLSIVNPSSSALSIVSGTINGEVERSIAGGATGSYVFTEPNTSITPNGSQSAMIVSVKSFPGIYPPNAPSGTAINRYYNIQTSGALQGIVRLSYLETELNGIAEANLSVFRYDGSSWSALGGAIVAAENYIEVGDVNVWSTMTIGDVTHPVPIQLASFTGTVLSTGGVELNWRTLSEVNNYGFEVQRSSVMHGGYVTLPGSFIAGHGTTNEPRDYNWIDHTASTGTVFYRLRQIDVDGSVHFSEAIRVDLLTHVQTTAEMENFHLAQNYPNPFNPTTSIRFSLPATASTSLEIFSALGRKIAVLYSGMLSRGQHNFVWDAAGIASGTYYCRLISGNNTATRRILLLK